MKKSALSIFAVVAYVVFASYLLCQTDRHALRQAVAASKEESVNKATVVVSEKLAEWNEESYRRNRSTGEENDPELRREVLGLDE